jgi:hypothetical protein
VKRFLTVLALGLAVSACSGAPPEPPAPPPLDPTGTFRISIDAEGMQVGGTLVIRETETGYAGSIDTDMGGAAIADVAVEGNEMTFSVPDAGVYFTVVFEGDEFTGGFDGAMGAGTIRGVRRTGG